MKRTLEIKPEQTYRHTHSLNRVVYKRDGSSPITRSLSLSLSLCYLYQARDSSILAIRNNNTRASRVVKAALSRSQIKRATLDRTGASEREIRNYRRARKESERAHRQLCTRGTRERKREEEKEREREIWKHNERSSHRARSRLPRRRSLRLRFTSLSLSLPLFRSLSLSLSA